MRRFVLRKNFTVLSFILKSKKEYVRAAVLKMLQYARDVIHLNQVYAVISADNAQSLKLFEEVGFTEGAVLKQWLYHNGVWQTAKLLHFFL